MDSDPYLSWLRPDVAGQMKALADLNQGHMDHPPYQYFIEAMIWLRGAVFNGRDYPRLLDAGCGTGHYAPIVGKLFRWVAYRGIDFSPDMIRLAKQYWIDQGLPDKQASLFFWVADAKTLDYSPYDIVLASSLIEVLDDWKEGAEALCTAPNIILLHRVRYGEKTKRVKSEGYPGQPTWMWVHDETELIAFFGERHFDCIYINHWDTGYPMATYIFQRKNG